MQEPVHQPPTLRVLLISGLFLVTLAPMWGQMDGVQTVMWIRWLYFSPVQSRLDAGKANPWGPQRGHHPRVLTPLWTGFVLQERLRSDAQRPPATPPPPAVRGAPGYGRRAMGVDGPGSWLRSFCPFRLGAPNGGLCCVCLSPGSAAVELRNLRSSFRCVAAAPHASAAAASAAL